MDLEHSLENVYTNVYRLEYNSREAKSEYRKLYLEFNASGHEVEIPTVAGSYCASAISMAGECHVAIPLLIGSRPSNWYKTLESNLKSMMNTVSRELCWITNVKGINQGDSILCGKGLVIRLGESEPKILMVCSSVWDTRFCVSVKTRLRINPDCFKEPDSVDRFITGRLLTASTNVSRIKDIVIEEIPFRIKEPDIPSTTVSGYDLKRIIYDHVDDLHI